MTDQLHAPPLVTVGVVEDSTLDDDQAQADDDVRDAIAVANGESLADRFQRRLKAMEDRATAVFAVPGWDGELALRLRKDAQYDGIDPIRVVLEHTTEVLMAVDPGGDLQTMPGAWQDLATLIGDPKMADRDVVSRIFDADNPNAVMMFATDIRLWAVGVAMRLERRLGE